MKNLSIELSKSKHLTLFVDLFEFNFAFNGIRCLFCVNKFAIFCLFNGFKHTTIQNILSSFNATYFLVHIHSNMRHIEIEKAMHDEKRIMMMMVIINREEKEMQD